jgi:hypothetical protein
MHISITCTTRLLSPRDARIQALERKVCLPYTDAAYSAEERGCGQHKYDAHGCEHEERDGEQERDARLDYEEVEERSVRSWVREL